MKFNRMIYQWVLGVALLAWVIFSGAKFDSLCEFSRIFYTTLGILLLFFGIFGRLYATLYIGGMKNVGNDGNSFISEGIYSVCRNPLYFFSFIGFLGLLCLKGQISLLIVGGVVYLVIYRLTILGEEKYLGSQYGESYAKFLREVPRFFPNFAQFRTKERVEFMPKFLHKEFKQSLVWILCAFVIFFIGYLQNLGVIKVFISVY